MYLLSIWGQNLSDKEPLAMFETHAFAINLAFVLEKFQNNSLIFILHIFILDNIQHAHFVLKKIQW